MIFKHLTQKLFLLSLLLGCCQLQAADAIQDEWDNVERLVILGDIHGDYDNYIDVLHEADVINRRGNWRGENTHLVQVGDVPDRGPDTDRIIEHLQKLERQAERDGGKVHVLIGNHEYMNVIGDLRYVHPGEYEAMESRNASRLRDAYYQQVVDSLQSRENPPEINDAFKEQWYNDIPLGYVEHRLAWQPGGDINEWVSTHNSVIRINDMLFMHAGLGPGMLEKSIRQLNEQVRLEILGESAGEVYPPNDAENTDEAEQVIPLGEVETGPLWYRGLALNPEVEEAPHVQALLDTYRVNTIVVGHTPALGVITPRFGGQVIITDTGISTYYGGHKASMIVENGERFALQQGERIALPTSDEGIIPYFQALVDLGAGNERLSAYLENLINPLAENTEGQANAADTTLPVELPGQPED